MRLSGDLIEVDTICDRIAAKRRGYCPQKPSTKQQEFLSLDHEMDVLYGGAGSGGKSSALLMAALKYIHVPKYSALILRRTYKDLNMAGAIMDRAHEWFRNTDATWNAEAHRYTFPSGARITFGHMHHESDKANYKGAEFQYIGIDEATEFPPLWITFLFSRLRKTRDIDAPLRMRLATNPGGIAHVFIYDRYVSEKTRTAPFVAAGIDDNPHVDQESYRKSLEMSDKLTRDQVLHGLWLIDSSLLVYQYTRENWIYELPTFKVYILGMDFGTYNDACSFSIMGIDPGVNRVTIVRSYKRQGMAPGDAAEEAQRLNHEFHFREIVGDANGLGKAYMDECRRRFGLSVKNADKANKPGHIRNFNGELERKLVSVYEPDCQQLIKEANALTWFDATRTKETPKQANDCCDSALYAWRECHKYLKGHAETSFVPIKSTMQKW